MRFSFHLLAFVAALVLAGAAEAADVRIGLATPLSEDMAVLGNQMRAGAQAAAEATGAELSIADAGCTAEGGAAAARDFARQEVEIVIGFLCTDAIEAALPLLSDAGIPVITPGVRTDSLTDRRARTGWLIWRVAPRADAERAAVAGIFPRLWREHHFAIIDDGTIYGRELAETLRLAAEQAGLEPVFVDTFRPQLENQIGLVGRLRRAGATHVFVGGDREDIAIMARDAAELDYPLVIAAGEALRAPDGETPLAEGTLMLGLPEWADIADDAATERLREAGIVPEGYVLPAYAVVEIAAEAFAQAQQQGTTIAETLSARQFTTALGTIAFDDKGDLAENPYRLFRHDGEKFVPAE